MMKLFLTKSSWLLLVACVNAGFLVASAAPANAQGVIDFDGEESLELVLGGGEPGVEEIGVGGPTPGLSLIHI